MAEVYQACFPREKNHAQWIEASFNAYPRGVYYVVEVAGVVRGYILWCVKNGFREKSIIELEQIGIHPDAAGQGLGKRLIVESLAPFKAHVRGLGCGDYGAGDEVILYNLCMAYRAVACGEFSRSTTSSTMVAATGC
ncbi:GNAT family N-acetyltransferase [Vreelandella stevensii]|uniref:GNAT family N-acetyltransferase n=1 Tax=Vreelandella stevensii TaxID=502821 RepID=UPI003747D205